jgi:hypothetical protein
MPRALTSLVVAVFVLALAAAPVSGARRRWRTDGTGGLDVASWANAIGATESGRISWTCNE